MNSLVDYEDSDSEDSQDNEEHCPGKKKKQCEKAMVRVPSNSAVPHSDLAYDRVKNQLHTTTSAPPAQRVPPNWPLPKVSVDNQKPQSHSFQPVNNSGSLTSKRLQPPPAGLRPYVSKRQKLASLAESPNANKEDLSDVQGTGLRPLLEVSEKVRPFLGRDLGRTELPRYVQHHVQAHQGPVNTVQWCPVPHLSHLLLSASMDKTLKIWDGVTSGKCLQTYSVHSEAVRDACWMPCGRRLLSGSFDNTATITDVETGQVVTKVENQFRVASLAFQPSDPDVFLCGGFSSEVKAWDSRSSKVVRVYKAGIQQTLDILFLGEGKEFITSSDAVSRDSADRTLIAWDFATTAKISNQIFHERYTCPTLALHSLKHSFIAQTNGNYIALFSAQKPYRMNKRKRFEGHKVEGYAIHCELSSDGTVLASGSSTGSAHFYDFQSTRSLLTLSAHPQACMCVSLHPIVPAVVATCDWGGEVKIWN